MRRVSWIASVVAVVATIGCGVEPSEDAQDFQSCSGKCDGVGSAIFYAAKYSLKVAKTAERQKKAKLYVIDGTYARDSAESAAAYLRSIGWKAVVVWVESHDAMAADLDARLARGERFKFLATVSHAGPVGPWLDNPSVTDLESDRSWLTAGWDWYGPGLVLDAKEGSGKASLAGLRAITDRIRAVTTPDAHVMFIGCKTALPTTIPREQAPSDPVHQGTPFFMEGSAPLLVDNSEAGFAKDGAWVSSRSVPGFLGGDYLVASPGTSWAVWHAPLGKAGTYEVQVHLVADPNRTSRALYRIYADGQKAAPFTIDQRQPGPADGWVSLQKRALVPGAYLSLDTSGSDGFVVADAARFIPDSSGAGPKRRYKTFIHAVADLTGRRALGNTGPTDLGSSRDFAKTALVDRKVPYGWILVSPQNAKEDGTGAELEGASSSHDEGVTTVEGERCAPGELACSLPPQVTCDME